MELFEYQFKALLELDFRFTNLIEERHLEAVRLNYEKFWFQYIFNLPLILPFVTIKLVSLKNNTK